MLGPTNIRSLSGGTILRVSTKLH